MGNKFVIYIFVAVILGAVVYFWEDVKLSTARAWGFFTITNNPLLEKYDEDFKNITETEGRIDRRSLLSGGPPKDGIPSMDSPQFDNKDTTPFGDDELIIGVFHNGEAKAYPYGILNWHEIVNDTIGGLPIAVSYCPLCETNSVFIRMIDGEETTFGVSGKLYHSCLVMYDRKTDSLWVQPWGIGALGEKTNDVLERIPAYRTELGKWVEKYPDTKILSTKTGHRRNYSSYPYGTYYTNDLLIFPVRNQESREVSVKETNFVVFESVDNVFGRFLSTLLSKIALTIFPARNQESREVSVKEITFVVFEAVDNVFDRFGGNSFVAVRKEIESAGEQLFALGDRQVRAVWDGELETVRFFYDGTSEEVPSMAAFGFVYPAFFQ
ncbi:MAG: DUF3179 domain-containing protein [Candidatus Campbellbacteria bacterium]|nr:DUF3179 domain-containing protein [Candidatus Campbellbacteria bacterium]